MHIRFYRPVSSSLVLYYAPNRGQAELFSSMLGGGGLNVALDHMLDKLGNGHSRLFHPPKQSVYVAKLLHLHGIVDSWRDHVGPFHWRINETLLSDQVQSTISIKELQKFFYTNNTEGISP